MKNTFKLISLKTVLAIAILFSSGFLGNSVADVRTSHPDVKHACLSKTTDDATYMMAVERVISLKIVKDWEASLDSESRMAFLNDRTEFVNEHCYWSIALYKSDSKQMQLWKLFRVGVASNDIHMMDDDGDYIPIAPSSTFLK